MSEKVKKDVIYIDIEDDITDVVSKIKSSKERIIAVVPPKGIGVLRSAVNLRLLARTADKAEKKIVIVSNNSALRAMSAVAQIPVAKTLQSKPEIPEIDALEIDGEDVIDGEKMPISEFAGKTKDEKEAEILEDLDIDDNKSFAKKEPAVANARTKKAKAGVKIPDFAKFRKKIFIAGGAGLALIIFLIWAIVFAPFATVIITAKTSTANVSGKANLVSSESQVDANTGKVLSKVESMDKDAQVEFEATETKDVGEAAKGSLTLYQSGDSDSITVARGTAFSAGGCNFVTTSSATIPGAKLKSGSIVAGSTSVDIQATAIGEQCNLSAQKYTSSIDGVQATGGQLSGGTKKTVKVLSQSDVDSAKSQIAKTSEDQIKNELTAKLGDSFVAINDSFSAKATEPSISANVGDEVSGKITLKAKTTYSISGVSKSNLEDYLKQLAKGDSSDRKVYESGINKVEIANYTGNSIDVKASAKVGPTINEDELKGKIHGKKFGEVQSIVEGINGVENVEVKFSQFWVNTVPSDNNKIKIEFTVK